MNISSVQTRDQAGGLRYFDTLGEAFHAANEDSTIWKVSFTFNGEAVRMIREERGDPSTMQSWVIDNCLGL